MRHSYCLQQEAILKQIAVNYLQMWCSKIKDRSKLQGLSQMIKPFLEVSKRVMSILFPKVRYQWIVNNLQARDKSVVTKSSAKSLTQDHPEGIRIQGVEASLVQPKVFANLLLRTTSRQMPLTLSWMNQPQLPQASIRASVLIEPRGEIAAAKWRLITDRE